MAEYKHPETGEPMNPLTVRNPRLDTPRLQKTVLLLRQSGTSMNDIAAHLGTHSREVCRALNGHQRRRYPKLRGTFRADPRQTSLF